MVREIGAIARPRRIMIVPDMPKTRSGKIMRRVLAAISNNEDAGDISTLANPEIVEEITADEKVIGRRRSGLAKSIGGPRGNGRYPVKIAAAVMARAVETAPPVISPHGPRRRIRQKRPDPSVGAHAREHRARLSEIVMHGDGDEVALLDAARLWQGRRIGKTSARSLRSHALRASRPQTGWSRLYAASEGHSKRSDGARSGPVEASVLDGPRYPALGAGAPIGSTSRPWVSLMTSAAAR